MYKKVRKELIEMSDKEFAKMTLKTCPEADIASILGIRVPQLRKKAKEIAVSSEYKKYIDEGKKQKSDKYVEEIILEGLVIAYCKMDLKEKLEYMKLYIPQISNWLINDIVCSTLKVKKEQEKEMLWNFIIPYLESSNQFEVRFAVTTMLNNFIVEKYVDEVISKLDKVTNKEYYAEMAISWTLAEIGIKFNDRAMKYLKGSNNLDKFTFNKTLQKMRESYRVPAEQKEELKKMKIK
ncbi:MAG: DNA alkylation repair protein [Bacilli bacterium]|nr:DNA alkylation repair protein [Bacilli bacterium]